MKIGYGLRLNTKLQANREYISICKLYPQSEQKQAAVADSPLSV